MPFEFLDTGITGPKIIIPILHADMRGFFFESYRKSDFNSHGIADNFVQQNISLSAKNVLRGLHYQLNPAAQGKLVSVMSGRIFDVAVDIRKNSPTFGKYISVELSSSEPRMFWIPAGFAHGFVSLEDGTRVSYLTTREYSPQHERGIIWNDPDIGIKWPVQSPIIAERDSMFPRLREAGINFEYGDAE
jgi:dTDP-4-dehydrorhamnose 3,5-epimerase